MSSHQNQFDLKHLYPINPTLPGDEEKLRAIEDVLVNGTVRMSPRLVAETVLAIARVTPRPAGQFNLKALTAQHFTNRLTYNSEAQEAHEVDEHRAECCEHTCNFTDPFCPVVEGAIRSDMPCDCGGHGTTISGI